MEGYLASAGRVTFLCIDNRVLALIILPMMLVI